MDGEAFETMWDGMLEQCLNVKHGIQFGCSSESLHERRCKHQQRFIVLLVTDGRVVENLVQNGEQSNVVEDGLESGLFGGQLILSKRIVEFQILSAVP